MDTLIRRYFEDIHPGAMEDEVTSTIEHQNVAGTLQYCHGDNSVYLIDLDCRKMYYLYHGTVINYDGVTMNLEYEHHSDGNFVWQLGTGIKNEAMNGLAVTAYLDIECETRHKGVLILPSDFISHQKQRTALLSETYPYCEYPEFSSLDKFLSSFEQEERDTYTTFIMCLLKDVPIDKEVLGMIDEFGSQESRFLAKTHDSDECRNMILSLLIRLRSYVKEKTETSPVGTSTRPKGIRYYG